MMFRLILFVAALTFLPLHMARASGGEAEPLVHQHWHFSGAFGTYDRAALQRGYKIYREVCASCHSMKQLSFRNLTDLGYNENQIKAIAGEYSVEDGPNEEGEMFERPARPSDSFPAPFANDKAAAYANGGALPPDLSLIIKARHHGSDYVYGLLTGYEEAPHDAHLLDGQYWNKYMPGHVIAMAPPLSDGQVAYEDGSPDTTQQYAADVVEFLTWAGDPHMETRKRTGLKAIMFLVVFAFVMYAVKRQIWSDVH